MEEPITPPKKSFAQRYKFVLPALLTVTLGVGAYQFMTTERKDKNEEAPRISPTKPRSTTKDAHDPVLEKLLPAPANLPSVKVLKPISDDEKRQLFMWVLEEKRKSKTITDLSEKKQIDEEKALLKRFIRGKSIPSF